MSKRYVIQTQTIYGNWVVSLDSNRGLTPHGVVGFDRAQDARMAIGNAPHMRVWDRVKRRSVFRVNPDVNPWGE